MRNFFWFFIILLSIFSLIGCDVELIPSNSSTDTVINGEELLSDPLYDRLFNQISKKSLVIEITQANFDFLDDKMTEYYKKFGTYKDDTYISANVIYEDDFGVKSIENIGFRTRGNLSRGPLYDEAGNVLLNHFKLKFNETFVGSNSPGYFFGLEELDLKYNRNNDPTYLNELGPLMLYESMGVISQKATLIHVSLKIDDTLYQIGVMTAFEPIDEWFIQRRFEEEDASGDLYKSLWQQYGPATLKPLDDGSYGIKDVSMNYRPAYDLKTNKKTSNHQALLNLVEVINHPDKSFVQEGILTLFDMDYLARYFAVSLMIGNPDDFRSMGNNYYLYYAPKSEKYYLIPYDLDHSLGSGWGGEPTFTDQLIDTPIYHLGDLLEALSEEDHAHPLIEHLFEMEPFKYSYENSLERLLEADIFTVEFFENRINIFDEYYQSEIENSKVNLPFGLRDLETFIEGKKESIRTQIQP
jgi:spore coat protein CotH